MIIILCTISIFCISLFPGVSEGYSKHWEGSLLEAVMSDDAVSFECLITQKNINAFLPIWGWSLLHWVVLRGNYQFTEILLKHGAEVNAVNETGYTSLHWAARDGRKEIVELLIQYGANIYVRDREGQTPLMLALQRGHTEISKLLKEHAD